ncbi:MAG: hypothetical protein DME19_04100 [Verrucomicrobia bacterium]|nr:MAG: hypothetical protein DME19_04100 [Verrucomicrobiota bacterium]
MCAAVLFADHSLSVAAETISPSEQKPTKPAPALPQAFARFVNEKRALAAAIGKKHDLKVPSKVWEFFAAAQKGDWAATSNLFFGIEAGTHRRGSAEWMPSEIWGPIHDTFGAYELVEAWNTQLLEQFAEEIVKSIPSGSIYFGGTEGGRFAVSAFSQSHSEGRPFFTLTQNALADSNYLGYLTDMYGARIHLPNTNESQKCFEEYLTNAQARLKHDRDFPNETRQIRPGEDVRLVDGKVQVNGPVAVMAINSLIVKLIFDRNPERQFYVEESYPLDWTYPHLAPHQFIFKLSREPLKEIPAQAVRADREFWIRHTDSWLGAWLKTNAPVREVTDFVERTYLNGNIKDFNGDLRLIRDLEARKAFSHLRASIGGLYAWRAAHSKGPSERQRMMAEADFAFRQAFAICPVSPETVARYVELLVSGGRLSDAEQIAVTAYKLDPEHKQLGDYAEQQLLRAKQGTEKAPAPK